jgi:hypothetical protein
MKPFDLQMLNSTNKAASGQGPVHPEANVQQKQQLWQLLLPTPDKAALPANSATGTDAAPRRNDGHAVRNGAAGELAATAYLLAGYVQQLSLYGTSTPGTAAAEASYATLQQAVTLRVDANTTTGGLASLDVSHAELGQIALAVELADGAVRVTATVSSARSAEVLLQGQALLAQRLLQQGIALEALDVVVVTPKRKTRTAGRARPRRPEQET